MKTLTTKGEFNSFYFQLCGMAGVFLLHGKKVQMTDEAIFQDTSEIIKNANCKGTCFKIVQTNISATTFEIAFEAN
jgi:hypothetical protein